MQDTYKEAFPPHAMCEAAEYSQTWQVLMRNVINYSSGPQNWEVLTLLACWLNRFISYYEGNDPTLALQGMQCIDLKHVPTS